MYYTVNNEDQKIIDVSQECPDPQEQANYFKCSVYIIKGEYSGLEAKPEDGRKE